MKPLIVLGDNLFFGINHLSDERAAQRGRLYSSVDDIVRTIERAQELGIDGLMLNTNQRAADVCAAIKSHAMLRDMVVYPSLPYAHRYAGIVAESGVVGALRAELRKVRWLGREPMRIVSQFPRSGSLETVMKLLVWRELQMFRELQIGAVFLQNIVTDLMVGLGAGSMLAAYARHLKCRLGLEAAFNTMNAELTYRCLTRAGVQDPLICAPMNPPGFMMCPGQEEVEHFARSGAARLWAMSVFASGAATEDEVRDYLGKLRGHVDGIVFGASTDAHISATVRLIRSISHEC